MTLGSEIEWNKNAGSILEKWKIFPSGEVPPEIKTTGTGINIQLPWYNFIKYHNQKNGLLWYLLFWNSMRQNSARLDCENMEEMGEETTNKSKHTRNNQVALRNFRDDRYPCI